MKAIASSAGGLASWIRGAISGISCLCCSSIVGFRLHLYWRLSVANSGGVPDSRGQGALTADDDEALLPHGWGTGHSLMG